MLHLENKQGHMNLFFKLVCPQVEASKSNIMRVKSHSFEKHRRAKAEIKHALHHFAWAQLQGHRSNGNFCHQYSILQKWVTLPQWDITACYIMPVTGQLWLVTVSRSSETLHIFKDYKIL